MGRQRPVKKFNASLHIPGRLAVPEIELDVTPKSRYMYKHEGCLGEVIFVFRLR